MKKMESLKIWLLIKFSLGNLPKMYQNRIFIPFHSYWPTKLSLFLLCGKWHWKMFTLGLPHQFQSFIYRQSLSPTHLQFFVDMLNYLSLNFMVPSWTQKGWQKLNFQEFCTNQQHVWPRYALAGSDLIREVGHTKTFITENQFLVLYVHRHLGTGEG